MQLNPHRLLVLRAVKRMGGVHAAADALHLTPSGVSQHLTKLESEAGVRLVDRDRGGGRRRVVLTAAGHALADQAEQVAAARGRAQREAHPVRHHQPRIVRVGGFASALNQLVVPVVTGLSLSDPTLDPRITEVEEQAGVAALLAGELDLLLGERPAVDDPPRPRGVQETDLLYDPFQIVVPEAWPPMEDASEILSRSWVLPPSRNAARRALELLAIQRGISLDVRHVGHESSTMLGLVKAGLGAAIIPRLTLTQHATDHVRFYGGDLDPGSRMITVLQSYDQLSPAAGRLRERIFEQAGRSR
jgi:DNA-binding transcriptional LysR family regulator